MLYMRSCLHCSLPLSAIMSLVSAMLTVIVCGLCRAARCCAALTVPSMTTTTSGRLAVLIVITTLVISGPLFNVCVNLRAMSSSLVCGVELGCNQTALMASSMDTLSSRLTTAVSGLQRSIRAAWRDLRPLDEGLMRLNGALYNGVIQLYGAHKVLYLTHAHTFSRCLVLITPTDNTCDVDPQHLCSLILPAFPYVINETKS